MLPLQVALLIGVTVSALVKVSTADCPNPDYIRAFGCTCNSASRLHCNGVKEERQLRLIMTACEGYNFEEFVLTDATLDWLPEDLFHSIRTQQFVLARSTLRSLAKPSDTGNHLFADSGLKVFALDSTTLFDGDFISFRDLDGLEHLAIRNYTGDFFINYVAKLLAKTNLQTLILDNIPKIAWRTGALNSFTQLTTLSLAQLGFEQISRSDLPENLENLKNLWLRNNMLTSLSPDFLEGLDRLKTLDLSNNQLQELDEGTFFDFHGLIGLNGNPLRCNGVEWLRNRLRDGSLRLMFSSMVYCDGDVPLIGDL